MKKMIILSFFLRGKAEAIILISFFIFSQGSFSQNVGIGTNSPLTKLHVESTSANIATFNGGSPMYITLAENGLYRGYIGSYSGNAEDVDLGTYGSSSGKVHLTTLNIPRLTVMNNGNIGIGTVTPQLQFSVAGGMNIDQDDTNNGTMTNMLRFGSNSGEGIGSNRTPGVWNMNFFTDSKTRLTISNGGNVGINLTNPGSKLEIRGALGFSSTTKKWEMNYDSTAGYFYIDEFGAGRRFYIKNGGNVGINTNNPQTTLDVNGDLNIENKLMLNNSAGNPGQVLISNGSSTAPQWKDVAYSNNDRFRYIQSNQNVSSGSYFLDTLLYTNNYALSSAITYSNGIFTVNKSGLYSIDAAYYGYALLTNNTVLPGIDILFLVKPPSAPTSSVFLVLERIPYTGLNGGNHAFQGIIKGNTNIHMVAGTEFHFFGEIYSNSMASVSGNAGFVGITSLTINLISE